MIEVVRIISTVTERSNIQMFSTMCNLLMNKTNKIIIESEFSPHMIEAIKIKGVVKASNAAMNADTLVIH